MKRAAVTLIVLGVLAVVTFTLASIWTGDPRWGQTAAVAFSLTACTAILTVPVLVMDDQ